MAFVPSADALGYIRACLRHDCSERQRERLSAGPTMAGVSRIVWRCVPVPRQGSRINWSPPTARMSVTQNLARLRSSEYVFHLF
jgi:hypothetical protein